MNSRNTEEENIRELKSLGKNTGFRTFCTIVLYLDSILFCSYIYKLFKSYVIERLLKGKLFYLFEINPKRISPTNFMNYHELILLKLVEFSPV